MTTRCRTGTSGCSSQELDRELSDVLIAISVVSKESLTVLQQSVAEKTEYGRRKLEWEK